MSTKTLRSRKPAPYWVRCRHCKSRYDLLAARMCQCPSGRRTRICLHCGSCLCADPIARDPEAWVRTPARLGKWIVAGEVPVDYL